jgi:hypothetical protein
VRHNPGLVFQAAAAALHDMDGTGKTAAAGVVDPLANVPAEIAAHVDALDGCRKPASKARARQLRCSERPAKEAELRRTHAAHPIAAAMLDCANTFVGQ